MQRAALSARDETKDPSRSHINCGRSQHQLCSSFRSHKRKRSRSSSWPRTPSTSFGYKQRTSSLRRRLCCMGAALIGIVCVCATGNVSAPGVVDVYIGAEFSKRMRSGSWLSRRRPCKPTCCSVTDFGRGVQCSSGYRGTCGLRAQSMRHTDRLTEWRHCDIVPAHDRVRGSRTDIDCRLHPRDV
jgi:hypothetical protein